MTVSARIRMLALPSIRAAWRAAVANRRGITREDVTAAFLFGCAYTAYYLVLNIRQTIHDADLVVIPMVFVSYQIGAFTMLLGVSLADSVGNARLRRVAFVATVVLTGFLISSLMGWIAFGGDFDAIGLFTLLLALVVVRRFQGKFVRLIVLAPVIVFSSIMFVVGWQDFVSDPERVKAAAMFYPLARHRFFEWLLLAGAAVFVYLDRRRTRAARAKRHVAEVDRARSAKRALESRLQAMQARVEPQFLFNTLAQVHDLYRTDPGRGELMLDELIAYLRAAMPKMRDTSSTLGQEIELVRAYLGIVSLRLGGRLVFEIDSLDPRDAETRIPPMMLLPLVDHAVSHGFAEPNVNGSIHVHTEIANGRARLEITDSGVGFLATDEGENIVGIRERLQALFGDGARLDLDRADQPGTRAVMEIPYEPLDSGG
jgi:sensor histidine kinase YesM